MEEERLRILGMVESGQIDPAQAATLLAALDQETEDAEQASAHVLGPAEHMQSSWARFWIYPMVVGGCVLVLGALAMGLAYATGAGRGWLVCGWLPITLGFVVMLLALWSRRATWIHLRISEGGSRKVAFSLPLPLTLAAWAVRIARPFIPQLEKTGAEDLLIALRESASRGEPLAIDVQNDDEGERVELYIC